MSSTSRPAVHSLLTVVFVLLLGMMAMLSVNNQRHQRLADQTADLQRSLTRQAIQINSLRGQLRRLRHDAKRHNPRYVME